jgi:hypothetical protein
MGLFSDGFKELKKASEPLYKSPKSIQERKQNSRDDSADKIEQLLQRFCEAGELTNEMMKAPKISHWISVLRGSKTAFDKETNEAIDKIFEQIHQIAPCREDERTVCMD